MKNWVVFFLNPHPWRHGRRLLEVPRCLREQTRSSKIGTGCQSIYNICILNDCKLTGIRGGTELLACRRMFRYRIGT